MVDQLEKTKLTRKIILNLRGNMMNALVINCSPVRTGATAEIVHIVSEHLKSKYGLYLDDIDIKIIYTK